jgi:predicted TPR repeat methyltransferase
MRKAALWQRSLTGHRQSPADLGQAANRFWNDFSDLARAQEAHWRGHGAFADDAVWLRLGQDHFQLLQQALQRHGLEKQAQHVVEWGCGGGMNAVHFGRGAKTYHGVDIAASTLAECGRQMQRERLAGFVPVLVDANQARAALPQIGNQADLFICTYLFELLTSDAHALELLDIAHAVLRPGGVALVHIRCSSGVLGRSRPWDYAQNMAHNVTFSVDQFRQVCKAAGFQVLEVVARPAVPELNEKDYAYFVLLR